MSGGLAVASCRAVAVASRLRSSIWGERGGDGPPRSTWLSLSTWHALIKFIRVPLILNSSDVTLSLSLCSRVETSLRHSTAPFATATLASSLPPLVQATAGAIGAVVSNSLLYPLDVLTTRMQTARRSKKGTGESFLSLFSSAYSQRPQPPLTALSSRRSGPS